MSEARLQAQCIRMARKAGCLAYKVVAVGYVGFPDTLIVFRDRGIVLVEFKQPGGRLRPQQRRRIKQLKEYGVTVYVCDAFEEFKRILERHKPGAG